MPFRALLPLATPAASAAAGPDPTGPQKTPASQSETATVQRAKTATQPRAARTRQTNPWLQLARRSLPQLYFSRHHLLSSSHWPTLPPEPNWQATACHPRIFSAQRSQTTERTHRHGQAIACHPRILSAHRSQATERAPPMVRPPPAIHLSCLRTAPRLWSARRSTACISADTTHMLCAMSAQMNLTIRDARLLRAIASSWTRSRAPLKK